VRARLGARCVWYDSIRSALMVQSVPFDWTCGDLSEGLRCFHSGAFFEAHEHWELVWLAAQGPEKTFLQGLIQVAASFHHFQRGNCVGTISLLRSALRRLDKYPEVFAGIVVAPLRVAIHSWLEALETTPQSSPPPFPQLQLTGRGSVLWNRS
jgi:predicted metal-dependent hydrolase